MRTWSKIYTQMFHTEVTDDPQPVSLETSLKAIVQEGMAGVHELSSEQIETRLVIAQAFNKAIESKTKNCTLVHAAFDCYNVEKSLKAKTRNHRQTNRMCIVCMM